MKNDLLEEHVRFGEARFRDKNIVRPFVNRIYQDLAELKEDIEPKTCDGCKWLVIGKYCALPIGTCIRKSDDYFEPKEQ